MQFIKKNIYYTRLIYCCKLLNLMHCITNFPHLPMKESEKRLGTIERAFVICTIYSFKKLKMVREMILLSMDNVEKNVRIKENVKRISSHFSYKKGDESLGTGYSKRFSA